MHGGRTGRVEPITQADTLGDIHSGDLQQGRGISTSQAGRVGLATGGGNRDAAADMAQGASQGVGANLWQTLTGQKRSGGTSLTVWLVFLGLLILIKCVAERAGEKSEFASVRIGLENWFVVGGLAATFLYAAKMGSALLPWRNGIVSAIQEFFGIA